MSAFNVAPRAKVFISFPSPQPTMVRWSSDRSALMVDRWTVLTPMPLESKLVEDITLQGSWVGRQT